MIKWILAAVVMILICGVLVCWDPIAAAIDNAFGIRTRSDVRRVRDQRVGPTTLGELIGPGALWSARHRDEFWRTFVECRTRRDDYEVVYHWEVDHGYSPRLGYAKQEGVFITPLTRDTAGLAPSLMSDDVRLDRLPEAPSMSARAIYQHMGLTPRLPLPDFVSR